MAQYSNDYMGLFASYISIILLSALAVAEPAESFSPMPNAVDRDEPAEMFSPLPKDYCTLKKSFDSKKHKNMTLKDFFQQKTVVQLQMLNLIINKDSRCSEPLKDASGKYKCQVCRSGNSFSVGSIQYVTGFEENANKDIKITLTKNQYVTCSVPNSKLEDHPLFTIMDSDYFQVPCSAFKSLKASATKAAAGKGNR